jgi:hypothetical protein
MSMQDRRRPPRGRSKPEPVRKLSADEAANLHKVALQYRDELREKVPAAAPAKSRRTVRKLVVREKRPILDGAFAAAIARAEFGRFYWNEALDEQLKAAMKPRTGIGDQAAGIKKRRSDS